MVILKITFVRLWAAGGWSGSWGWEVVSRDVENRGVQKVKNGMIGFVIEYGFWLIVVKFTIYMAIFQTSKDILIRTAL